MSKVNTTAICARAGQNSSSRSLFVGAVKKGHPLHHGPFYELRHVVRFTLKPRRLHQQRRDLRPGDVGQGRGCGLL